VLNESGRDSTATPAPQVIRPHLAFLAKVVLYCWATNVKGMENL